MSRKSRNKDEDFGLKKSSGVNYGQVLDRQIDDDRFERQRAIRVGAAPVRSSLLQQTFGVWMTDNAHAYVCLLGACSPTSVELKCC